LAPKKPKNVPPPPSTLEARARQAIAEQRVSLFKALCRREKVPEPVIEHHFAKPERAWRFDLAWIEPRIALEVEGGAWTKGRHVRGAGFIEDMHKYNRATELGWRVFRVTPSQLDTLETVAMIKCALQICVERSLIRVPTATRSRNTHERPTALSNKVGNGAGNAGMGGV